MASPSGIFQVSGTCNNYPWGQKGSQSLAARLCKETPGNNFEIKEDEFYSEMWFGDYPDFPGRQLETGKTLGDLIAADGRTMLGEPTIKAMGQNLPFLPKILSIASALPLQIHPNKNLAAELHNKQPDKYTDTNHKPEIAVALSEFELFVGWKPKDSIDFLFQQVPSLQKLVPDGSPEWTNEQLRSVVRKLLSADDATVKTIQSELVSFAQSKPEELKRYSQDHIATLLPRLQKQTAQSSSSTDSGTLVALLCMNYLVLQPGESVYVPADGIHAYLAGDIMECMARSNNMMVNGLCPVMDRNSVDLFVDTLTFSEETQGENVRLPAQSSPKGTNGHTKVYQPPISEFDVMSTELEAGEKEVVKGCKGPMIAIVVSGKGTVRGSGKGFDVKEGYIFYITPETDITWYAESALHIFAAVVRNP